MKIKHHAIVAAILLLAVGVALWTQRLDPESAEWPEDGTVPLLYSWNLPPIFEQTEFTGEGMHQYPRDRTRKPPQDDPFATDSEAIAAAERWIVDHFGALPPNAALKPTSVAHSSSGIAKASSDDDRGHTITFRETFHGIETNDFAVVYISGRSDFSANVALCRYEIVPRSAKPIVSAATAISEVRSIFAKMNPGNGEFLKAFDQDPQARLVYMYADQDDNSDEDQDRKDDRQIRSPYWIINGDERLFIDAYTGKPIGSC
jgi:hypothetical protein